MQEQNYIRGLRLEQLKTTLGAAQQSKVVRGIVEKVYPLQALAIVAVEGADLTLNRTSVEVISIKSNSEQKLDLGKEEVGSGFTRYYARMSDSVLEGQHVILQFIQGQHLPTILKTEVVFKDNSVTDPIVVIDKETKGFKFINGGNDTAWTKSYGVAGYRFSPFSQYPQGSQIKVADGFKLKKLPTTNKITDKKIKDALKPSTPSGHAVWADDSGIGHIALFADSVHVLGKESNEMFLGSNSLNTEFLRNPLNDLSAVLGIEDSGSAKLIFNSKTKLRIPVGINALASEELSAYQSGTSSYVDIAELTNSVYNSPASSSEALAKYLKTGFSNENYSGLTYYIAASICAAVFNTGSSVLRSNPSYFQVPQNLGTVTSFNPETNNNQEFLSYLNGTGQAWAMLVSALRLSLLIGPDSLKLRQALNRADLKVYRTIDNGTSQGYLIKNLFGFSLEKGNLENSLNSNFSYIKKLVAPSGFILDPNSNSNQYTYGDIITCNLFDLQESANQFSKDSDLYIPNMIAFPSSAGSQFSERLYFKVDTSNGPVSSVTLPVVKNWLLGLYAAQVRTVVQEVCMIMSQYEIDLQDLVGSSLIHTLRPTVATVSIRDIYGNIQTGKGRAWSSSFITYLMIRLFNGNRGREAAQEFLETYATTSEQIKKEDFSTLLAKYTVPAEELLAGVWWSTLESRYKLVANILSRSGHLWRA